MRNNNLNKVEKNLKYLAKRYKNVKYSLGLAILFLMVGVSAFSEEVAIQENTVATREEISTSKEKLKNSVGNLQSKINSARTENEKGLKGLRLELIQLMEQGNQVIKSPWSSWQFGANYVYNSWGKSYKGYGDKGKKTSLTRDTSGSLKRFLEGSSFGNSEYGLTSLALVSEPPAKIEISAGIRPKNIDKEAPSYTPVAPAGALPPFEPKLISPPGKPSAPVEVNPTTFSPPDINFKGMGFSQGARIGISKLLDSNAIMENYDTYDTVNKVTDAQGIFNIEVGNLPNGKRVKWYGTNLDGTVNPDIQIKAVTNVPNIATPGLTKGNFNPSGVGTFWLDAGEAIKPSGHIYINQGKGMNAFINELRDHDATISGNYIMTNKGGENELFNRIFLSHNPAGVGNGSNDNDGNPVGPGGWYDGTGKVSVRTATFNGNLTLHGTPNAFTGDTAHSDVTIGVEHQLWSRRTVNDWITLGSYSTFNNTGKITLASGNNLVGILIDVEAWNIDNGPAHNTKNNGIIEITNAQNSIGIDYGQYADQIFKSELTVGNVIVGGKKNYGLRMANIFTGNNNYFDKGTTIKSGGADKKILVKGEENVGVSIAKFLSSAKDSNPIAGITEGLNIEVTGEKNIGFLRHKTYANNTGDMVFNSTTMGTFVFGNGAKNSTLIRTDKYGIQVRKDITSTDENSIGNGNTVLHSNGEAQHINNYNTITIGKGYTQTVGMAATGNANSTIVNILNEGTVSLLGEKSIGMYVDGRTTGKSTGLIKLSGITENIGIFNKGEFTLSGNLEVNGKKSSGIYNTGETTITVGASPTDRTNITATNGATALYSKGHDTKIDSTAGNKLNINVNAGTTKEGLAVYAEDKSEVLLHNANINVNGGSAGVASYGLGTKVDLAGVTLKYNGEGYAVYSDGKGQINLKDSNIELRGSSTLMELDFSIVPANRPIKTSGTSVKVFSNDVVAINVSNLGTKNISTLSALKGALGVSITAGTEGGKTFNKYKELAIENGEINFDVVTDKGAPDTTPGGFFFKKVLGQRLRLNVNENLTARLSSAVANEFYGGQVVGLEANSSKQAISNTETQVNIANGKVVDVARTDSGSGGVGVFINYGLVDNKGTISIEKDSVANSNAVGVYAVNGSKVTNNGAISVSGKDAIGILGVAYRTDSKGNNVVDEFGSKAAGQGKVNILNKGQISLDGQGGTGIFAKNNKTGVTLTNAIAINDTTGKITITGNKAVGISGEKAEIINKGIIDVKGQEGTGMFAKSSSKMENSGIINIAASTSASKPNIGMFTEDKDTEIHNNKDIIGENNTYGIYGKAINVGSTGKIKVGDNSVGVYSNGQYSSLPSSPTVNLASGSTIEVGKNQAVGIFLAGKNQNVSSQADMKIGDNSYGYVVRGTGTKLKTNSTNIITVGNDVVFAYSTDTTGNIENRTSLTSTGNKNYGIYAAGNVTNLGNIDFSTGVGNVGMYSISGGKAINGEAGPTGIKPTIKVSASDVTNKFFGIGMAAGYTDDNGVTHQTGTIENYGIIKVEKENGIGMYATGSNSKAINKGTIELSGKNTTGMYLDNGAKGENWGTITTIPNATNDGIVGVYVANDAVIKNYGTIEIKDGKGVYLVRNGIYDYENSTGTVKGGIEQKKQSDTGKVISGIEIVAPGDGTATIKRDGKVVVPTYVDTTIASAKAPKVRVGTTELDLRTSNFDNIPSIAKASELGMYVDTSGVNYTNPIKGLNKLTSLKQINLIFGTEASRYTDSKNIQIGPNIIRPYNDVIVSLSVGGGKKFAIASSSLTWIATGTQNPDDSFKSVYLVKIPYTSFAKEKDTFNFMDGLEQRYGIEKVGSREKILFDKLNALGKSEGNIFAQAVDEMKGHQYSNVEQRVNATSQILDKEFDYLRSEWSNPTKDSNKVKTFGTNGEYKTETEGVIDYKYNAYGVAYVHENEDIKLGKGIGWYTGIVHNTFKFKDLGKSKEEMLQGKVGLFKSVPFDDNNSLNWTISGDIFVGYNKMNRKFLVVDEIFNAKSKYYTYGIGIKNEIGKEFRLSEGFALRPYIALDLEYGRVSKLKEKNGEIKLEVKSNDYISIRPEIGTELSYKHYFGTKTFKAGLGVAYENELGKVGSVKNKARVAETTADWYNLRGEKEDRRGNVKFDLNLGLDNQRYGVTANVGYDTKGENVRGGLGLRVIF